MEQLPAIRRYTLRNGRNNICFNHVLGVCPAGSKCRFDHVSRNEIDNAFCTRVIEVIDPGIEKVYKHGPKPWTLEGPGQQRRGE